HFDPLLRGIQLDDAETADLAGAWGVVPVFTAGGSALLPLGLQHGSERRKVRFVGCRLRFGGASLLVRNVAGGRHSLAQLDARAATGDIGHPPRYQVARLMFGDV